jgi:hypothetical protein
MPYGPEKVDALKRAGLLRRAADAPGITFARRADRPNRQYELASAISRLRASILLSASFYGRSSSKSLG